METYKIVRRYFKNFSKRTIDTGLTLQEAKDHCSNPETSSRTCTSAKGKKLTQQKGPWFDGYEKE